MNPPTRIGVTSLTTSISAGRSNARCSARRTRGSSSGFFLWLSQTPWMTLWLNCAVYRPGVSLALRTVTGSVMRM